MQLEGIDHVALGVRDIEQSVKWYIEVLGFERLHDGVWNGVPTFIGKGNTGIALFPASPNAKPTSSSKTMTTLGAFGGAFTSKRGGGFASLASSTVDSGYVGSLMGRTVRSSCCAVDPSGSKLSITTNTDMSGEVFFVVSDFMGITRLISSFSIARRILTSSSAMH